MGGSSLSKASHVLHRGTNAVPREDELALMSFGALASSRNGRERSVRLVWLIGVATSAIFAQTYSIDEYNRAWILTNTKATRAHGIEALKAIIERHPNHWRAYRALAEAWRFDNDGASGIQYFTQLQKKNLSLPYPHLGASILLNHNLRLKDAVHEAAECVRKDQTASVCYLYWAQLTAQQFGQKTPLAVAAKSLPSFASSPYACAGRVTYFYAVRQMQAHLSERDTCYGLSKSHPDLNLRRFIQAEGFIAGHAMVTSESEFDNDVHSALATADQANDYELYARLLDNVVDIRYRKRDFSAGGSAAAHQLQLSEKLGQRERLSAHYRTARFLNAQGDADGALARWQIYRKLLVEEGDVKGRGLVELAAAYRRCGRTAEALATLEDAQAIAQRLRENVDAAFILRTLSIVQQETGDYWNALRNAFESVRLFRSAKMPWQAGAGEGNLPEIYLNLGVESKAIYYAQLSLNSARLHGDQGEEKRNLGTLGEILLRLGRTENALAVFEKALLIKQDAQGVFEAEALLGKAEALRLLGRRREAFSVLAKVLAHAESRGETIEQSNVLYAIGQTELDDGNLPAAEGRFQRSLLIAEKFQHSEMILANRRALAEIFRRQGEQHKRWQALEPALTVLKSLRSHIPTPELRQDFQGLNAKLFEDAIDTLVQLHASEPSNGWDRKAFAVAEQGRARVLVDLMTESRFQIGRSLSVEQKGTKDQLEQRLSMALAKQMSEPSEKNAAASAQAEQALSGWIEAARTNNPDYIQARYPEPASITDAQRVASRDGTSILMYALGQNASVLWVITPSTLRMVRLPAASAIEKKVKLFRNQIGIHPTDPRGYENAAKDLYNVLVQPALRAAPSEKVLIVPDGVLFYLPFEALVRSDGRFLIEQQSVNYAPSVSAFLTLPAPSSRDTLLAYGDPIFSAARAGQATTDHSMQVRSVMRAAGLNLSALPNSRTEVQQIAKAFPPGRATVRVGNDATEASVKADDLTRYGTLHFATHALFDERVPSRSGIMLNLVNTGREDGVLRAAEVLNLRLRADLVVLSACQTGLGSYVRGEGILGLTRSFLAAGASRVVVSLWPVDDAGTVDLMSVFYHRWNRQGAASDALRAAKLEMIKSKRLAYRHPYFWAGFVQSGLF